MLPKQLFNRNDYEAWGIPLWPVGRSLKVLFRDGHVELRLRITFHAADGREVVRFRKVDLWLPVGLNSRRPA